MTVEIVVIFILFIVLMTVLEQKMGRNIYLGGAYWYALVDSY